MKKVILFFTALLIVSCSKSDSSSTTANQLSITKLDGTVINNGAVLTFNTAGDENAIMKFYVKNLSSAEIKVRARCVSISNATASNMQFCFGQVCYAGVNAGEVYPVDSHEIVAVPANGQVGGASFHFQNFTTTAIDYVFEFYQYDANDAVVGNKVTVTYRYQP